MEKGQNMLHNMKAHSTVGPALLYKFIMLQNASMNAETHLSLTIDYDKGYEVQIKIFTSVRLVKA